MEKAKKDKQLDTVETGTSTDVAVDVPVVFETASANDGNAVEEAEEAVDGGSTIYKTAGIDDGFDFAVADEYDSGNALARRGNGRKKSRKVAVWTIVAVTLLICALLGAWFILENQTFDVETVVVQSAEFSVVVTGSGKVQAFEPVDVYSKNEGIVGRVLVKEGQTVAKGAPLLELESGPLEAQLALAESGLAQATNGLAQAQSGASQQTSAIDAANAGISAAQTGVNVAHDFKSLADKAVVDAQKYLDALQAMPGADPDTVLVAQEALSAAKRGQTEAAAGIAQTNGQLASAQGALAQAQSGNTSAAITAAHAAIAAAEEQVELASKMLEDAVIKASVAGKIIFVQTDATAQSQAAGAGTPISGATLMAGSAIAPGMPLFTIISPDKMIFVAEVNEADIARIKIDHKATVTLDSFAGTTFTGTVTKIAPVAQMTMTGSTVFPVEITLDPTKEKPAIGMKGDAAIQVSTQQGVTTIPVLALFSEGGKQFVYVLRDGRLAKTPITTGEVTDAQVEVISGVVSGQEVVLASNIPFTDSMRVRVRAR